MNTRDIAKLRLRSELTAALREGFADCGFAEVHTPVKIAAPAPEEFIEAVRSEGGFLRTSPELEMKILLASGMERIYQIGSCFRAGEFGRKHREEFTMLEYYAAVWDYRRLAEFTAALLISAAEKVLGGSLLEFAGRQVELRDYGFITVAEAFERYAATDCFEALRRGVFDELMVTEIEPKLGLEAPVFLCDYPAERASLARLCPGDGRFAERWELYIGGLELGNAFGELTDPVEQRRRFAESREFRRAAGMHEYPEPVEFFAALDRGLPESSGCAIGLDRLAMVFANAGDIGEVL